MRNLKRALSLTLASVMLLGMMVVGSSAMSFNDADEISNVTAATVLEELDIMVGDGVNFNPDQVVTRGEMAVIVCKILYGEKLNVSQFIDGSKFTDVPANHYANGYVNLANQLGIIAGYGNGMFGPSDTVTTAQAALMLTKALGYFKGSELTGDWSNDALTAAATATRLGLFDSLNLGTHEGLTRDNVAAMTFNTITNAVPVQYNEFFHSYYTDQSNILQGVQYDWKDTLGYANFSLVYTDSSDQDEFGRPAIVWGTGTVTSTDADGKLDESDGAILTLKDEIITSAKAADKVYVGEVKAKDIYSDLNMSRDVPQAQVDVYTDSDTPTNTKDVNKNDSDTKFGTDGQTVEVWYTKGATAAADEVTIVITSTYLGIVVDDNYREDGKDGIRIDVMGVGLKFFEATGYNDDDVVLVTVADGDVQAITGTPKTITGETTRVSTDVNKALTIDGTKYPQSIQFSSGDGDVVDGESNANLAIEKTYTLYLDQNDCYLAAVEVEDNTKSNIVYVFNIREASTLDGDEVKTKAMATVVYMDGTYKDVPLTKNDGTDIGTITPSTTVSGLNSSYRHKLAELVYDEDDNEYEIKPSSDYTSVAISNGSKIELEVDSRYAKLNGSTNVYLNGDTVYVFVDEDDSDPNKVDSVKVVTGGVDFDIETGMMTGSVYAVKTGENTAKYVVIANEYEASAKDIVYIKAGGPKQVITDGRLYEGYFADSTAKEEISVDKSTASYTSLAAGFYEYSEKSNGNLKLTATSASGAIDTAGSLSGTITSIIKDDKGYLMTISGGHTTYDLNNVNVVDMTDKDKDAENTYGSNVTSLSALQRVVDQKTGGVKAYVVTVSVYVNKDNEVTNLVISNIANKTAGTNAVYDSDTVTKATLTATNTVSIGGVDVNVTESSDIDAVVSGLSSLTTSAWTITKTNSDKDLQFEAKTAGALGSAGAPTEAQAAGMTQVTEGTDAVAATGSITLDDSSVTSVTIGGTTFSYNTANSNTADDGTYTATFDNTTNVVSITAKTAGASGNGDKTIGGQTVIMENGADAVKAVYKVTDIAGKISSALSGTGTLTVGDHTATVTTSTLAEQLEEFVEDYNQNATAKGTWVASVNGDKIRFTAVTAGAAANDNAPTGTTQVIAGADAN